MGYTGSVKSKIAFVPMLKVSSAVCVLQHRARPGGEAVMARLTARRVISPSGFCPVLSRQRTKSDTHVPRGAGELGKLRSPTGILRTILISAIPANLVKVGAANERAEIANAYVTGKLRNSNYPKRKAERPRTTPTLPQEDGGGCESPVGTRNIFLHGFMAEEEIFRPCLGGGGLGEGVRMDLKYPVVTRYLGSCSDWPSWSFAPREG